MDSDTLVVIFAITAVFGFPIAGLIVWRWFAHRERMEMIRHGMPPPAGRADWRAMRSQAQPDATDGNYPPYPAQVTLRKGITVAFIGLALTIGLSFIGYQDTIPFGVRWVPGPWLLGGIVPLFVGLAQIASALLSGATLGAGRRWDAYPPQAPAPPPAGPGEQSGPGQTFEGSYTYRPGTAQELRPPVPPPERRP
jgi:hypothetical protein